MNKITGIYSNRIKKRNLLVMPVRIVCTLIMSATYYWLARGSNTLKKEVMERKMKTLDKLRARKNILLGQVEQIVLLAILHRLNRAYGTEINNEIEVKTGIKLTVGALYSTLDRMVQKDLIICVDSAGVDATQSSKSRRYFSITTRGRQLLDESINIVQKMKGDIDIWAIPSVA